MNFNEGPYYTSDIEPPPDNTTIGNYKLDIQLVKPTYCSFIFLGYDTKDNQKKVIKLVKLYKKKISRISDEVETMNLANHPNILKMDDAFRYGPFVCIVTPYTPYQSLHHLLLTSYPHGLPEETAVVIFRQMLQAVSYLHGINVWHRDIKPDNFLVFDPDPNQPKVVLADFGFAKLFQEGEYGDEFFGTMEFLPPEMLKCIPYDKSVDVYSLGISLFVMLVARYPTPAYRTAPDECKRKILRGHLNYQLLIDYEISPDAVDLIRQMCRLDPNSRISVEEALQHPWVASSQKQGIEDDISNAIWNGEEVAELETPGT